MTAAHPQLLAIQECAQHHSRMMPAAFTANPLWPEARWSATTYAFHPTGEAPPVMGLVFENTEAAEDIFMAAKERMNNHDRANEIRVSIIEGDIPGQEQRPGYSVHICPDPESLAAQATADGVVLDQTIVPFLGQWNRHYPIPGTPQMLPKFKREFQKHGEYMLAPVVRREDGQLHIEPTLGIVKKTIEFRQLSEILGPGDPDASALVLPSLITPPT